MNKKKINIVLLGGNGFIGKNLIRYFIEKKLKTISVGNKNNQFRDAGHRKKKTLVTNIFKTSKYFKYINDHSIIIFLATPINCKTPLKFIKKYKKLVFLLKKKKICRFLLVSSVDVYEKSTKTINEENNCKPQSDYGKLCLKLEKITLEILQKRTKIVRISNTFGIYRKKLGIIEKILFNLTIQNKYFFANQNIKRSFISVDDVCKTLFLMCEKNYEDQLFNLTNNNYIFTFNKLLSLIKKNTNTNVDIKIKNQQFKLYNSIICSRKIRSIFKIKFKNNFFAELTKVKNFLKNNRNKYN